jgi:hypothetical protein
MTPRLLAIAFLLAPVLSAHGGQYRAPNDVIPPSGGNSGSGSGSASGGSAAPGTTPGTTPGATGGSSGARPTAPAAPRAGGGALPRAMPMLAADSTRWQLWWEFHKDHFLRLRGVQAPRPAGGDLSLLAGGHRLDHDHAQVTERDQVRVAMLLHQALAEPGNRDLRSACLVALAKIGRDHDRFRLVEVLSEPLTSDDQEIRETAALALGISGKPEAVDRLIAIARDDDVGRELLQRTSVDDRTRSFAIWGLGLLAHQVTEVGFQRKIFHVLGALLRDPAVRSTNVQVALVHGLRMLAPPEGDAGDKLRRDAVDVLAMVANGERLPVVVRSHVPIAIATLLQRGGDPAGRFRERLGAMLTADEAELSQSAAIALGLLLQPAELDKAAVPTIERLRAACAQARDPQTQRFAAVALARIGGDANRTFLLAQLAAGKRVTERPWFALALGLLEHARLDAAGQNATADVEIGQALRRELRDAQNPEARAAFAVALGLARFDAAEGELTELLLANRTQDELAGYLAISLGLLGGRRSIEDLRQTVTAAAHRPELLRQSAIALGCLGDRNVADLLHGMLRDGEPDLGKLSALAVAIGRIGDRRSIEPLSRLLFDSTATPLARAFAAVALGGLADKAPLPWNAEAAASVNYHAVVDTLLNGSTGILDIL